MGTEDPPGITAFSFFPTNIPPAKSSMIDFRFSPIFTSYTPGFFNCPEIQTSLVPVLLGVPFSWNFFAPNFIILGSLQEYEANGGYLGLKKALNMQPEEIVNLVKESGLRGRGGAGFPTGLKWSFMAKNTKKVNYLICNADEGEPGTCKDRELMLKDPHLLVCFYNYKSCGQCTPCREGFNWIRILLVDLMRGKAENDIIDSIYRIARNILGNTLCALENWLRWFHNYKNGKIYPRQ